MSVTVTLHIFSGRPDPAWELTDEQVADLVTRVGSLDKTTLQKPPGIVGGLGYRGFSVQAVREPHLEPYLYLHNKIIDLDRFALNLVDDSGDLESWLLSTSGNSLDENTARFIQEQMEAPMPDTSIGAANNSLLDAAPPYNPGKWNNDPAIRTRNNCYNYGNDLITNTFAQPGLGSGQIYGQLICSEVTAAARRDRLASVPNVAGTPAQGHYVALVTAPGMDYHWYRLDENGRWSHKPGQTAARDTDNSGSQIVDPQVCDRGPYTDFCGFFQTIPASVRIL